MAPKSVTIDAVTQNNMVTWRLIEADLAKLKELELQYRNAIIPAIPFDHAKTVAIDDGFKLELDCPMYYSIKASQDVLMATMNALYEHNPVATVDLLRWKPEISVSKYRTLTEDEKKIIAPILNIKPGQATLTVIVPKEGKSR
jgi:hypothetical protein